MVRIPTLLPMSDVDNHCNYSRQVESILKKGDQAGKYTSNKILLLPCADVWAPAAHGNMKLGLI